VVSLQAPGTIPGDRHAAPLFYGCDTQRQGGKGYKPPVSSYC